MGEELDLGAFEEGYEEEGRPASAPSRKVKVWLHAYALRVISRRWLKEDLALRYSAAEPTPDHRVPDDFRTQDWRPINDLFAQVVEVALMCTTFNLARL